MRKSCRASSGLGFATPRTILGLTPQAQVVPPWGLWTDRRRDSLPSCSADGANVLRLGLGLGAHLGVGLPIRLGLAALPRLGGLLEAVGDEALAAATLVEE